MSLPDVVTRQEWLRAREALLHKEKEQTRQRDALNAERRELPMVEITQDYVFEAPEGPVMLADLFEGRSQLVVYHFMFDPSWDEGCPSCTAGTDEMAPGLLEHLAARDTGYAMVSRAPLEKLERWKAARGWTLRWVSSHGTTFNADLGATVDPRDPQALVNYRTPAEVRAHGDELPDEPFELPGRSCFLRVGDRIFHTYSQFARGLEFTGGSYAFLDLTALGRQEDWEEPKGRSESVRAAVPVFD